MKLTNELRDWIVHKVITTTFGKREVKLEEMKTAFADKLWEHQYGTWKHIISALPSGFMGVSEYLKFKTPNHSRYECDRWKMSEIRQLRFDAANGAMDCILEQDHPLFPEYTKVYKFRDKLDVQKEALKQKTKAVLNSVNTKKQLLERWPGAEEYFPAYAKAAPVPAFNENLDQLIYALKKED